MEEYKPIVEFETYDVSNLGNVKNKKTSVMLKTRLKPNGYCIVDINKNNRRYTKHLHRLIAEAFIPNPENKPFIDHIDNNKLNNNINNLRWVTNQENQQNQKLSTNNTSGIKGVYLNKKTNKWIAYVTIDGKKMYLGCFENIDDAKAARITKAQQVFGVYINSCELN